MHPSGLMLPYTSSNFNYRNKELHWALSWVFRYIQLYANELQRLVLALRSTKSHLHDFKKDYARPTDENSCVDIHGKFCAWPCINARLVIRWSFITLRIIVYFVEWRMSRKYVSSVRGTKPKPWHLERKIQNIAHIQRV